MASFAACGEVVQLVAPGQMPRIGDGHLARLIIGLIVRNGGRTLASALESLLAQTFRDFRVIVGDNASTDDTADIADSFAARDDRVSVVRHPRDLARSGNLRALLAVADTPYFMWAAADDRWAPAHLEWNMAALEGDPGIVGSQSRVLFLRHGQPSRIGQGSFALEGSEIENLKRFLAWPEDNSRFYGIFRTAALKTVFPEKPFHAYDWAISANTLRYGRHYEVQAVTTIRDETDAAAYAARATDGLAWHSPVTPLWPLAKDVMRGGSRGGAVRLIPTLARLNARIALRFFLLRRHTQAQGTAESGWWHKISALSAPGLRERLALWRGRHPSHLLRPFPANGPVNPKLSIVCIARDALESILTLAASLPHGPDDDSELVLCDRGSRDATELCLAGRRYPVSIRFDEESSFGDALKRALDAARAGMILVVEADGLRTLSDVDVAAITASAASALAGQTAPDGPGHLVVGRAQLASALAANPSPNDLAELRASVAAAPPL